MHAPVRPAADRELLKPSAGAAAVLVAAVTALRRPLVERENPLVLSLAGSGAPVSAYSLRRRLSVRLLVLPVVP
ncbi:MAG: hypothetical protein ABI039_13110, partial [Vicinamibacterales bacterium]